MTISLVPEEDQNVKKKNKWMYDTAKIPLNKNMQNMEEK